MRQEEGSEIFKKSLILLGIIFVVAGVAAGIFFFRSGPEPEQVFRANLTDAQKNLATLRRAETAYRESNQSYKYISARLSGGKMIYSEGWYAMRLPEVDVRAGFDYECLPPGGVCQALETGKMGLTGNGIRVDIETGVYACSGAYQPVTTEGFDGTEVTVGCRVS